jgi:hypothetical protein
MHKPYDRGEKDVFSYEKNEDPQRAITFGDGNQGLVKGLGKIAISPDHSISNVFLVDSVAFKGVLEGQLYLVDFNRAELDTCLIAKTNMGWLWHRRLAG